MKKDSIDSINHIVLRTYCLQNRNKKKEETWIKKRW